ncbi:MAG: hypothetical protein ACYDEY_12635 [Acidimicrobiales bacterium]
MPAQSANEASLRISETSEPQGKGETSGDAFGDKTLSPARCSSSGPNLASASIKPVLSGGAVAAARTRGRMPSGEDTLKLFWLAVGQQ